MYGKIFDTIYDGTLRANWQALVTFQQLIILADKDGIVDMTPHAIHGRTGIPLDIIEAGLKYLSEPDPYSRSNAEEGRRLILLDPHRPWGWRLVNHAYYSRLRSIEEKREADRQRIADKRKTQPVEKQSVSQSVADCSESSPPVAHVAPVAVAVTVSTEPKTLSGLPPDTHPPAKLNGHTTTARSLLAFLNEKTGRNYQPVKANLDMIVARLKEGATERQCRLVILRKFHDWGNDEKMTEYLRPATLFNRTKFAQYVGEIPKEQTNA